MSSLIQLPRPRVERERGGEGWMVILGSHGWLFGDRKGAVAELDELAAGERGPRGAHERPPRLSRPDAAGGPTPWFQSKQRRSQGNRSLPLAWLPQIDFGHGTFADFEAGIAGGVLDFIRHATGEDACTWLERQGLASLRGYQLRATEVRENADLGAQFKELSDEQRASADFARATFEQALPIDDVPKVAGYLAARGGLDISGCTDELRYGPSTVWEDERRKCLLVRYRNLINDEVTGIVRILLDEPEAWPKTQRKMLGVMRLAAANWLPSPTPLRWRRG